MNIYDMTHSNVWHHACVCVTLQHITHEHLLHDTYERATRRMHLCGVTHSHRTWCIDMCDMTHSHVSHAAITCVENDSVICVTLHIHMWHDAFTCVTQVRHDPIICVTCPNHTCDVTHSHVRQHSFTHKPAVERQVIHTLRYLQSGGTKKKRQKQVKIKTQLKGMQYINFVICTVKW